VLAQQSRAGQAAIANGVLDAVRSGDLPKDRVNELGIIVSVWLDPSVVDAEDLDHAVLFQTNREATAKAIRKAMRHEPSIDWLLEHQDEVVHYFHQLGLAGKLSDS
jgi:formaldehyde-activating enzyme